MVLALNGWELGLLVTAAAFIVFALVVALVVPRSWPEFPAKWLGIFIGVCLAFFAAQMTAVVLLAEVGEEEHAEAAPGETPGETTPEPTEPTETTGPAETTATDTGTTETETTGTTETTEGAGDATAGGDVFASAGCASCHTLADAGSTGTVGPNLDASSPSHDKVVERVTNGGGGMPAFKDTLTEQQIQDVAAYVSSVAGG